MDKVAKFFITIVIIVLTGCAPILQVGGGLTGQIAGRGLENTIKDSKPNEGSQAKVQLIDKLAIGQNNVQINKNITPGNFSIVFSAFDKDNNFIEKITQTMPAEKYIMEMRRLKTMGDKEKREYVHKLFLLKNIDLGPIEPETAQQSPSPSLNFPMPSFAPTPR